MIQSVFRAEGLPLDLAYIPIIESGFKTNALSKANAKGPWQFMKATAVEQGLKHDWYVDERSDPEKATVAAAKYLKTLYKMFNGDWHLVLAAYNGGLGRVQRAMKTRRHRGFLGSCPKRRAILPKETREYVPLILAAIVVAKNPAQYGFNVAARGAGRRTRRSRCRARSTCAASPSGPDRRSTRSRRSTPSCGAGRRRWRRRTTRSRCRRAPRRRSQTRLAAASPDDSRRSSGYTVRRGESIATIARKLSVSRADLAEANKLSIRSPVRAGQELVIPRAPTRSARVERAPRRAGRGARRGRSAASATVSPSATRAPPQR